MNEPPYRQVESGATNGGDAHGATNEGGATGLSVDAKGNPEDSPQVPPTKVDASTQSEPPAQPNGENNAQTLDAWAYQVAIFCAIDLVLYIKICQTRPLVGFSFSFGGLVGTVTRKNTLVLMYCIHTTFSFVRGFVHACSLAYKLYSQLNHDSVESNAGGSSEVWDKLVFIAPTTFVL